MNNRDLLIYILGYLKGITTMRKISKDKVFHVNSIIWEFKEYQKRQMEIEKEVEIETEYDEDYYENSNEDSLYNRPDFDHDMDIDQQGPDFDF